MSKCDATAGEISEQELKDKNTDVYTLSDSDGIIASLSPISSK